MSEASPGSLLSRLVRRISSGRSTGDTSQTPGAAHSAGSRRRSGLPPGVTLDTTTSEEREELLNSLPDVYFNHTGDSLDYELSELTLTVTALQLEEIADDRTVALEAVSEKLSSHIITNYAAFTAGVDEVIGTEEMLEVAAIKAKISRERLAVAAAEVQRGISVWRNTQRKRALTELLDVLLRVRRATELAGEIQCALGEGEFCGALEGCHHLAAATAALSHLDLSLCQSFQDRVRTGVEHSLAQIRATVSALTTDFQPQEFHKVVQAYALLATGSSCSWDAAVEALVAGVDPGEDIRAAFSAAPGALTQKVLKGVLLARSGLEERASTAVGISNLVALLPSDLFRTCLARVMMVVWDVLQAHHEMEVWHAEVQEATLIVGGVDDDDDSDMMAVGDGAEEGVHAAASRSPSGSCSPISPSAASIRVVEENDDDDGRNDTFENEEQQQQQQQAALISFEQQLRSVFSSVAQGISESRRLLWDESSRAVGVLLTSPAAVDGEHFMQVVSWTQKLAEAGESFCGAEAVALRSMLQRRAGAFFAVYHESNVEALQSMLEKELWKRLPVSLPPLFSVGNKNNNRNDAPSPNGTTTTTTTTTTSASTTNGDDSESSVIFSDPLMVLQHQREQQHIISTPSNINTTTTTINTTTAQFPQFSVVLQRGNPWRKPHPTKSTPPQADSPAGAAGTLPSSSSTTPTTTTTTTTTTAAAAASMLRLGFSGASVLDDLGTAAADLEVDEDGLHQQQGNGDSITDDDGVEVLQEEETQEESENCDVGGGPSSSSSKRTAATNSSWRMAKWMRDYVSLMTTLPGTATTIFKGMTELLDLYCLHVYLAFGDGTFLIDPTATVAIEHEGLTPRLRASLQHIAAVSMASHRATLTAGTKAGSKLARVLAVSSTSSNNNSNNSNSSPGVGATIALPTASSSTTVASSPSLDKEKVLLPPPAPINTITTTSNMTNNVPTTSLAHSGNLYGLIERFAAGDSLVTMAEYLASAVPSLREFLPADEGPVVAAYGERTLGAAQDLREALLLRVCRLMLPLKWVPEAVATGPSYQASEPPDEAAPWAKQLTRQFDLFGAQVSHAEEAGAVGAAVVMWGVATKVVAAAVVEGLSRVKKCTLEGRSAMSADLQALIHAVVRLHPSGVGAADSLRLADDYIKAFYVPLPELPIWASQHPHYSAAQVMALASCVGESSGLKRKELQAALSQVESGLRALGRH